MMQRETGEEAIFIAVCASLSKDDLSKRLLSLPHWMADDGLEDFGVGAAEVLLFVETSYLVATVFNELV